jgi:hypothetical protein
MSSSYKLQHKNTLETELFLKNNSGKTFRKEGLELEMDEKQGSDLVFWR